MYTIIRYNIRLYDIIRTMRKLNRIISQPYIYVAGCIEAFVHLYSYRARFMGARDQWTKVHPRLHRGIPEFFTPHALRKLQLRASCERLMHLN
jgi:hypothetical protein